ncbi:MAG: protein kinase [Bacilli bacterium]|nr:protein kinase [Bacilli bacterium]MDD4407098.1 protein kinase [Bacilli bacterium]
MNKDEKLKILNNYLIEILSNYEINPLYEDIYSDYDSGIKVAFMYLHNRLDVLLKYMNDRKTNGHYTANESRELITIIENIRELKSLLKDTKFSFYLDKEYEDCINFCYAFLSSSGGSTIPKDYNKIIIKQYEPILFLNNNINTLRTDEFLKNFELKLIGEGAYAQVFSFVDGLYNKKYALKRLKNNADEKDLKRFKNEYEKLKSINNPYLIEVYNYDENNNSYIMEFCDYTLKDYISKNNNKDFLTFNKRKNIALQFLRGIKILHNNSLLHRDISLNNILIKEYDDNTCIVKISDFGLIKDLNSDLTKTDSEIRGTIIDDTLVSFKDYQIKNEIYSIGIVLYFIFTGKTNFKSDANGLTKIIEKCIDRDHDKRYNYVFEIEKDLREIEKINKLKEESKFNDFKIFQIEILLLFKENDYFMHDSQLREYFKGNVDREIAFEELLNSNYIEENVTFSSDDRTAYNVVPEKKLEILKALRNIKKVI